MTFLDLCKGLVAEVGIAGGTGPASVVGQTGELANVVRWIRDSALQLDNLWMDWRYLWREYDVSLNSGNTPAGNIPMPALPANDPVRTWHRGSPWIHYGTNAAQQLEYMAWDRFKVMHANGIRAGRPSIFTVKPNNQLIVNRVPDVATPLHAEYWKRPKILTANADVPDMPEEYQRIIICRAAVMYGNREAAGEIISGMEAEYTDMLEKLQSDQLDIFRQDRMAGQDVPMQMEVP